MGSGFLTRHVPRDWPAFFPFIVTGSPRNSMWCSLIGQSLENYATVARQNFVNHFLMEMRRALAFDVKKRLLLVLQEGLY